MPAQLLAYPRLAAHLQRYLDLARWALIEAGPGRNLAPHGILLSGPPGGGKSRLTRAVAERCQARVVDYEGNEVLDRFYRKGTDVVTEIFDEARAQAPSILMVRNIEAMASRLAFEQGSLCHPLAVRLLAEIDHLGDGARVLAVGTTSNPARVAPELRQPGRLMREIAVPVPDREARKALLEGEAAHWKHAESLDFDLLARSTSGMTGSDLKSLCLEAWLSAERRDADAPALRLDDFLTALRAVEPTLGGELLVETPNIRWEHVGGSEEAKRRLKQLIEWPLQHADLFASAGVTVSPRVLLRGPSGAGKTLLARALARESGAALLSLRGSTFRTQHADPAAALRQAFQRARQAAPCILFLDELDVLLGVDLLQPFLAEMSDATRLRGIAVLAATANPERLDAGLLAPRLFGEVIDVALPDQKERRAILELHLGGRPVNGVNLEALARQSEGAAGADLAAMCQRALQAAVCRVIETGEGRIEVREEDFEGALEEYRTKRRRHFV